MSFSSNIKQELNKNSNLANKEVVKYELMGYLISGNISIINNGKSIKFSTESDYNINRFSKLLTNLNIEHDIDINGKNFVVMCKIKKIEEIYKEIEKISEDWSISQDAKKAIIRGVFMGGGSMNNPENKYHLEIILADEKFQKIVLKLLEDLGINIKNLTSQNKYVLYLKEGEEISNFLALIGANKAVMNFEDTRIKKEMRANVNRLVNCETANLNKTINASVQQIEAIRKLQKNGKFIKLDENLKEIANLRLENPDVSLIELGKLLKKPVGKSGVNYRLKKIMEIANE